MDLTRSCIELIVLVEFCYLLEANMQISLWRLSEPKKVSNVQSTFIFVRVKRMTFNCTIYCLLLLCFKIIPNDWLDTDQVIFVSQKYWLVSGGHLCDLQACFQNSKICADWIAIILSSRCDILTSQIWRRVFAYTNNLWLTV